MPSRDWLVCRQGFENFAKKFQQGAKIFASAFRCGYNLKTREMVIEYKSEQNFNRKIFLEEAGLTLAKQAMKENVGKLTRAAKLLHISRNRLRHPLKKDGTEIAKAET